MGALCVFLLLVGAGWLATALTYIQLLEKTTISPCINQSPVMDWGAGCCWSLLLCAWAARWVALSSVTELAMGAVTPQRLCSAHQGSGSSGGSSVAV